MKYSLIWSRISTKGSLIWLRKSIKESLISLRKSMKRSLICLRESMELDQQEAAAASWRNDPIVLAPESITLFAQGISLMIPSKHTELKVAVPNFEKKTKHKVVKELGKTLCWTEKDHKKKLRKDEELELTRAHRANRDRKISRRQRLQFRAYFV
ncbi:hypothetical protein MKW92_000081 [Papaver armeniacum]|nr:hypothetical protein MKW92_000081 [Papaver armeniacum]